VTSGDHLVQPPSSSRVSWSRLSRTMSSCVLSIFTAGKCTTSWATYSSVWPPLNIHI